MDGEHFIMLGTCVHVYIQCTFYSGGHFEGVWVANKKNGRGQYTLPNGRVIEGMYRDDKLVSQVGGNGHGSNDRPSTPLGNAIGEYMYMYMCVGQHGLCVQAFLGGHKCLPTQSTCSMGKSKIVSPTHNIGMCVVIMDH